MAAAARRTTWVPLALMNQAPPISRWRVPLYAIPGPAFLAVAASRSCGSGGIPAAAMDVAADS